MTTNLASDTLYQSSLRAVPKNMAKRVAAGISGSLHKTSSMGSMLSKATGGLVNFGGGGGHGGAGGSGASDALSTEQKQKNIGTAKVKDVDAAGHEFARDATIGEFMNERAGGKVTRTTNGVDFTENDDWKNEGRNFAENYTGDAGNAASSDGSSNAPETHANMTDGERGTGK